MKEIDLYYFQQDEPNQGCLLALRNIILEQSEKITESKKWGIPCFSFHNKMLCFLSINKKTQQPYLLMVKGTQLTHPELEQGNRSKMKIFTVNPNEDIPVITIEDILKEAITFY